MDVPWQVVPIVKWPGVETEDRKRSPFRAGWAQPARRYNGDRMWGAKSTLDILERELRHLEAEHVVIQMALSAEEIRLDGKPRANARPRHPGVILTFDSIHGPLSYPCDAFDDWQANVHAIALSLEALRKVDRYGVSKRGEQYTGWGQLPPAGGTTATMTARTAAEILVDVEDLGCAPDDLLQDVDAVKLTYRNAAKNAHPDRHGGDTRRFQLLQQAKDVLDRHHGAGR